MSPFGYSEARMRSPLAIGDAVSLRAVRLCLPVRRGGERGRLCILGGCGAGREEEHEEDESEDAGHGAEADQAPLTFR